MNTLKLTLILTLIFALFTQPGLADQDSTIEKSLGEKLLYQLWSDMKKPDMAAIENTIAEGFQSIHQFGSSNREKEIELIKGLKLGDYILSDIKTTRNGPVIIATYFVSVKETIKGKVLSKKPAARLDAFLKTDSGWKWIAHANLKPIE